MKKYIISFSMVIVISIGIIYMDNDKTNKIQVEVNNKKISMEEYICNLAIKEMKEYDNIEALKAFCVIIRSNFIKRIIEIDSYKVKDKQLGLGYDYGLDVNSKSNKLIKRKVKRAIKDTKGEIMIYNGKVIRIPYHEISKGETLNKTANDNTIIPYLKKADCRDDLESINYLHIKYFHLSNMDILNKMIEQDILKSNNYSIEQINNRVRLVCQGKGHNYGMSLYNANVMGVKGYSYKEILNKFYKNVKLVRIY